MTIDILIMALVAVFILLRLRSELGNTNEDDDQGPNQDGRNPDGRNSGGRFPRSRFNQPQDQHREPVNIDQDRAPIGSRDHVLHEVTDQPDQPDQAPAFSSDVMAGFEDIGRRDRQFNPTQFMDGARSAYPMILQAFWSGDLDTLKSFLSEDVYSSFSGAVEARQEQDITVDNRFISLDECQVISADLIGTTAEIGVKFTADIIATSKDSAGRIVEGDPSDPVTVHDIWTFSRDVKSHEPNWTLTGTERA